ncbi:MAG: cupin domain-containing protein [Spirochaetia bacterium]|jgi:mannose-6-phosphate isomerase-like protein (cupin superfamily)|nr:cupin domain-containing protein [Spirochaetia bacterium]
MEKECVMVAYRTSMKDEVKTALRGGPGALTMTDLTAGTGTCKNCRLLSLVDIPPGAGIGRHDHQTETEYYIMLEGSAEVEDGGTMVTVGPGDVVITGDGAAHSITNTGTKPVKMIAVIVTY